MEVEVEVHETWGLCFRATLEKRGKRWSHDGTHQLGLLVQAQLQQGRLPCDSSVALACWTDACHVVHVEKEPVDMQVWDKATKPQAGRRHMPVTEQVGSG